MLNLSQDSIIVGSGAAVGCIATISIRELYDQPLPFCDFLGSYNRAPIVANLGLGVGALALSYFLKGNSKNFLFGLGIPPLVGGLAYAILVAVQPQAALRRAAGSSVRLTRPRPPMARPIVSTQRTPRGSTPTITNSRNLPIRSDPYKQASLGGRNGITPTFISPQKVWA